MVKKFGSEKSSVVKNFGSEKNGSEKFGGEKFGSQIHHTPGAVPQPIKLLSVPLYMLYYINLYRTFFGIYNQPW